ncbi:hydrogenase expression/formation protein [Xanthobacter sp. KR7-225]|uniref:hydrogenase expression/formation protein n=1 Tax=Xanthobacter sp. KR7-225 TaxID=3156613 RepID=UPI0032B5E20F
MPSSPFATQPPAGFGPGSQSGAEDGLAYLPLPSGMRTFSAHLPEVEDPARFAPALKAVADILGALKDWTAGTTVTVPLSHLDPANRALVNETLGEGEVAVKVSGEGRAVEIQEATFAGVWRLRAADGTERVEVGAFPKGAVLRAFPARWEIDLAALETPMPGIFNAPPLLVEIAHRSATRAPGEAPHVINLSLLPHTPEDLALIEQMLGQGATTILSRGYGNCRIDSTATRDVWRVRYYNSTDMLILDTIEVSDVPEVALAAPEDIADSAERLAEVLAAIS